MNFPPDMDAAHRLELALAEVAVLQLELDTMHADMDAAASELLIDVFEARPGTTCGKLLAANVLMRRQLETMAELVGLLRETQRHMHGGSALGYQWNRLAASIDMALAKHEGKV